MIINIFMIVGGFSGVEKKAGSGVKPILSSQCRRYGVCSAAVRC